MISIFTFSFTSPPPTPTVMTLIGGLGFSMRVRKSRRASSLPEWEKPSEKTTTDCT